MIIVNGHIEFKTTTGGGIDPETGYPVKPSMETWGERIPCQFLAAKMNLQGRVNGDPHTLASYQILIDRRPIPSERIRLTARNGLTVGEFSIIQIEPLDAVCETRLWV